MRHASLIACFALVVAHTGATASAQPAESDDYTRYELLAPETAQFRIVYEVTATTPGRGFLLQSDPQGQRGDATRPSTTASSGKPLRFEVVSGADARAAGAGERRPRHALHQGAPAAAGAERRRGCACASTRPTTTPRATSSRATAWCSRGRSASGATRSCCPLGHELVACNVPAQVLQEADGRIKVSFMNPGPDAASVVVKARRLP